MYDPHTHPILVLQNLVNSLDFFEFFKDFSKLKQKIENLEYLFILNSPLENQLEFKQKYKALINFINSFKLPIILKTKNYHKFFINDYLKKKLRLKLNFLNENYFSIIDKFFFNFIKKNYRKYYKIIEDYFLENNITKTIDAFTTLEFLEFYNLINKKIKNKKLEIYYLLDPKIIFKINLKEIKLILKDKYFLGFKFFVDGTLANKDAMFYQNSSLDFDSKLYLNLNFYKYFLEKLYYILKKKVKINRISFAYHCIGDKAIDFTLSHLLNKYIIKISELVRVCFRIEHALFIGDKTIQILKNKLNKYNNVNFYFVFNPNFFFIDINFLKDIKYKNLLNNYFIFRLNEFFELLENYGNLGLAFASDCPVTPLNYEFSIFLLKNFLLRK
ncbi:MAG: hypothetical protein ACP5RD_03190 [bacterium]